MHDQWHTTHGRMAQRRFGKTGRGKRATRGKGEISDLSSTHQSDYTATEKNRWLEFWGLINCK